MFHQIINLIKIASKLKKKTIYVKLKRHDLKLIKILIKLNFIKFIEPLLDKKKKKIFKLVINTNNNKFKNIKNMYKVSNLKKIKLKKIKYVTYKKCWFFIMTTSCGILTNIEALKKKVGGVILFALLF